MTPGTYRFAAFSFDAESLVLYRGDVAVPLGRRAALLLRTLLERRGAVVSKAHLTDAAWPGQAVEDSNLSVQIAQLRSRLGGDWIRTIERVGYQFRAEPTSLSRVRPALPTLAVIPFVDLGASAGFAPAVTDSLLTALARFGSLRLLTSPPPHEETPYRLEGSIRRNGNRITIATRLIEGPAGSYFWADSFQTAGSSSDQMADRIASVVEAQVELREIAQARRRSPEDADAADLYRRAQFHLRSSEPGEYAMAAALLERAIALDPDNVAYLAAACEAYHHRIGMGWPPLTDDDATRCRDYALRGLRQPVSDGYTLALFGAAIFRTGDLDWGYALMQRAASLNPNSLMALAYAGTSSMHWGSLDDAETHYRRALNLDPHSPAQGFVMGGLARIRMIQGRFVDAVDWAQRAFYANPNYGAAHWTLVAANAQLGAADEAACHLVRFRALQPGVTVSGIRSGQPTRATRMASTLEGLERAGLPLA